MGKVTKLKVVPAEGARPALRTVAPPVAQPERVDVSIVIVTWNSEKWIERSLRAIPPACEGIAYEIVVYDNASGDETVRRLADAAESQPALRTISSNANDGFATGTNRGIAASRGRYVFLLNPDCELAPRALTLLFEFLEATPHAAAAAPLLLDESGLSQREFQLRRLPTLRSLASEVLLYDKIFPMNRATAHYRYRDLDLTEPRRIEQPAAAALLIRRDVFDEVGPLDEQFTPAWFEDVDYCHRLADHGKEVFVVPAAWARHYGGASLEHVPFAEFIDVWYRNMFLYARKWLRAGEAEGLRWIVIAGMLLRIVAAVIGFAHPELGRMQALRAYSRVLAHAFRRWSP